MSGFAIYWHGSLVKAASRQQAVMSLSSCESELIALTHATQEALGLSRVLEFLEWGTQTGLSSVDAFLERNVEDVQVDLILSLKTDSMSAYQVLLSDAFTRKVRHLDIAVGFLQRLCQLKVMQVSWISTHDMIADVLTKCLGRAKHEFFRSLLNVVEVEPERPWQLEKAGKGRSAKALCISEFRRWNPEELRAHALFDEILQSGSDLVWFDLCAEVGFRPLHLADVDGKRVFVVQSMYHENRLDESMLFFRTLCTLVSRHRALRGFISFSPPCTGGSPMQNLSVVGKQERVAVLQRVFLKLLRCFRQLQPLADGALLELSNACAYWHLRELAQVLESLPYTSRIDRCSFAGLRPLRHRRADDSCLDRHTYRVVSSLPFESCRCPCRFHEWRSSLRELGVYPREMVWSLGVQAIRLLFD